MRHTYYHLTGAGWIWASWIIFGVAYEVYDLTSHLSWTLSRNVWAAEHLDLTHPFMFSEWTPLHWIITVTLWTLFAWLSLHLPFGLLRG